MFQPKDIDYRMDTEIRPVYMMSIRDSLWIQRYIWTESEGMGKVFYANENQNRAGVAKLISDKIDFKIETKKGST